MEMFAGVDIRPEGNGKSEFSRALADLLEDKDVLQMAEQIHSKEIPNRFKEDPVFRMLTERSEAYQKGMMDGVKIAVILHHITVSCLGCGGNEFGFLMKTWKKVDDCVHIEIKCRNCGKVRMEMI